MHAATGGVIVAVHVKPRSGTTRVAGLHGDALSIRVAAPPVDGRANDAARAELAALLGVPESRVTLAAGERSRLKRFRVAGLDAEDAVTRIVDGLAAAG